MLRSQRILLVAGLLIVATILHTQLCEWGLHQRVFSAEKQVILAWDHEATIPNLPPLISRMGGRTRANGSVCSGLFIQRDTPAMAIVFGVVMPLALIGAVAYIMLDWRVAARRNAGKCTRCGYNLRGTRCRSCPECGTARGKRSGRTETTDPPLPLSAPTLLFYSAPPNAQAVDGSS